MQIKLHWGVTWHQSEWSSLKNLKVINAGEGVEKREPSYTVGGNINWCSHYREQYEGPLKKQRVTIGSSNPTPGHISRKDENSNWKGPWAPMFTEALFTIVKA